jgi:tetratricopeptide (TPR) repeat protein
VSGRALARPDTFIFQSLCRLCFFCYPHFGVPEIFSMCLARFKEKLALILLRGRFNRCRTNQAVFWPKRFYVARTAFLLLCLLTSRGFAQSQGSEQQIEELFRGGQIALKEGDFPRAVEQFKKVLELDPNLPEAEVNLGLAYQSLLQYDEAVHQLAKALRQRPDLSAPNVIVGMDYLKLGLPEKAIPFLQHGVKLDPANKDAREALAMAYLDQEKIQLAAEEYRQVASLDPDKPTASFNLGHEYLDLAARLAYRAAHLYRESAWGHRFLGDLLLQRNRWDEAAREYQKALSIDPKQSGLHTSLAESYLRAGNLEEADKEFHLELELDSRSELAWLGLARLQLLKGNPLEAAQSVGKAWDISPEFLKLRPEFPQVELSKDAVKTMLDRLREQPEKPAKHFLLAGLYATINEVALSDSQWRSFQDDISRWQKTSNANPTAQSGQDPCKAHRYSRCITSLQSRTHLSDSALLLLGKTYFTLQQYDRAAANLARVQGETSENAQASYWLERTYQALGAQAYAELEGSFPDSWRTHQLRAEGSALRGDRDNAIKEYQRALQLQPDEPELHEALGEFYLNNHGDEDAISELQKALSLDPSRTHALYLLGRLYVQQRENEKALPYLERALHLQPNFAEASGYLGTAYVRMGQFANAIPKLEKATSLDHYGNVHYQLYVAYRKLGRTELAKKALVRSQELRRSSLERDQALIMGSPDIEPEPQ